jgi:uncharacterized protein YkwD
MKIALNGREPTVAEMYALAEEAVRLVNIERARVGVRELVIKPEMMEVAKIKSQDMVDYNYYAHYPVEGTSARANGNTATLIQRLNIRGLQGRSECIDVGLDTPKSVVMGWMNSEGHRKVLLSDWNTHIGVGTAYTKGVGSTNIYWTLIVSEWTNLQVDSDSRESVQNQPKPVATNPATAYTPLKVS